MDNPFRKIIDAATGMLHSSSSASKGPGTSIIGVDIGTSSIKVVQLKKKGGKAILETYGALALGSYGGTDVGAVTNLAVDKLSAAIKDLIKESGVTTMSAALSIPSASSLLFLIDLPAAIDEKQVSAVIPTEARKYIPVPISEVSLDYWVIPKRGALDESPETPADGAKPVEAKTEVLIAAIHNDTIAKYNDIIKNTGLSSSFFEIEVFSTVRSTLGHELSTVLIMDLGASKTKLSIVEYGVVRSFHIINRGAHDITNTLSKSLNVPYAKAEEIKREFGLFGNPADKNVGEIIKLTTDFILSETNSIVLNYEKKYEKTISKVILTGGGALLKGFKEQAAENFRSEVVLGNPFVKTEAPGFVEQFLSKTGPEFSVAAGLALRGLQ